jgi:hypothetical protein
MHALTTDEYDKRLVAGAAHLRCVAAYRFIQHSLGEKQAMEMTEYGKP